MTAFNQFVFALPINIIWMVLLRGYVRHNRRILENTGRETSFYTKWNSDPGFHWTLAVIVAISLTLLISLA